MTDAELATLAGVPTRAITSMRAGIADWVLEQNAKPVAAAIGVDVNLLRASIRKAKKKVWGRGANQFPSCPMSNMGDIRKK